MQGLPHYPWFLFQAVAMRISLHAPVLQGPPPRWLVADRSPQTMNIEAAYGERNYTKTSPGFGHTPTLTSAPRERVRDPGAWCLVRKLVWDSGEQRTRSARSSDNVSRDEGTDAPGVRTDGGEMVTFHEIVRPMMCVPAQSSKDGSTKTVPRGFSGTLPAVASSTRAHDPTRFRHRLSV
ncbi:hypothetical protein PLICRDRAFT_638476 [Plicaturopsis crispa FD-325 SS-3]|nr:hypothetical protein PLICRDRAFT_638476 [Plicaturopsis crispa FD-325 SS-3]